MEMLKLQSDEIDKITTSFIEACLEMEGFSEDAKGNYGGYISVKEIKKVAYKTLLKHGVQYKQGRTMHEGQVLLFTKLTHTSGQWECSYAPLYIPETLKKGIDQSYGEAMSYQRRYELYGLFGILGDDLDPDSSNSQLQSKESAYSDAISEKQLGLLKMRLKDHPKEEEALLKKYNIDDLSKLSWKYMNEVVAALKPKE